MNNTTTPPPAPYKQKDLKQITLIFRLSMEGGVPWSGKDKVYALIKPLPRNQKSMEKGEALLAAMTWRYDFGDGWIATVRVEKGTQQTVHTARRLSQGFAGYEWMVNNILDHGSPNKLEA